MDKYIDTMRSALFALGLGLVLFTACHDDDDNGSPWGIGVSDPALALTATGTIDQQNFGPKETYTVKEALLFPEADGAHVLRYKFTSGDSLDLVLIKRTADYNYHSAEAVNQNDLAYAIFNTDTLDLKESAVSVQPHADINRFETVVNVHTVSFGDFNGTVTGVPYVVK